MITQNAASTSDAITGCHSRTMHTGVANSMTMPAISMERAPPSGEVSACFMALSQCTILSSPLNGNKMTSNTRAAIASALMTVSGPLAGHGCASSWL